jgi:hypothetical protein
MYRFTLNVHLCCHSKSQSRATQLLANKKLKQQNITSNLHCYLASTHAHSAISKPIFTFFEADVRIPNCDIILTIAGASGEYSSMYSSVEKVRKHRNRLQHSLQKRTHTKKRKDRKSPTKLLFDFDCYSSASLLRVRHREV